MWAVGHSRGSFNSEQSSRVFLHPCRCLERRAEWTTYPVHDPTSLYVSICENMYVPPFDASLEEGEKGDTFATYVLPHREHARRAC